MTVVVLAVISALIVLWYGIRFKTTINSDGERILVQRHSRLATETELQTIKNWLAKRWNISPENIYLIVEDSEPWMRILGLLDIETLASAKIWIINSNYEEGRGWISFLTKWNTPHLGQMYLESEYRPASEAEYNVAAQLYSTPTSWRENYFGNLAIITGLTWTQFETKTGEMYAYQSEKNLPSITIPIENGRLRKSYIYPSVIAD
jgi:hypothetical protein